MIKNQIKFIEIVKEWMHGCVMENTRKIKIKLEYLDWPYQEHLCTLQHIASFALHCGDKMGHPMDVPGLGL